MFTFARCLAGMAELVDALDLGSSAKRRGGSSPFARTRTADLLFLGKCWRLFLAKILEINFNHNEHYQGKYRCCKCCS
jgi:hypothetical protein